MVKEIRGPGILRRFWNSITERGPVNTPVSSSRPRGDRADIDWKNKRLQDSSLSGLVAQIKKTTHPETCATLVQGYNRFTTNLFGELFKRRPEENIFISVGIAEGLLSIYNGADGATRDALGNALGLDGLSTEEANAANFSVLGDFEGYPGVRMTIANCLLADKRIILNDEFLQANILADIQRVDFRSSELSSTIKELVSRKTSGHINDFDPGSFDAETLIALLVPVHFQGHWNSPFDKEATEPSFFMGSNGKKQIVPFMFKKENFIHNSNDNHEAIRLQYQEGKISLRAFLPHHDRTLEDVHETLRETNWDPRAEFKRLAKYPDFGEDLLYFPKFKFETEGDLSGPLTALGLGGLFSPATANLTKTTADPLPLYLGRSIQKSVLEVDEEGTKASEISAHIITLAGDGPEEIRFNHPFLISIVDDRTDLILFLGSITNLS